MRDALLMELHQEAVDADGQATKKLRLVARALVDAAIDGDVPAAKEINDRVDGKVPQAIAGDTGEGPVKLEIVWAGRNKS
jgi:hypothetical protein